MSCDRCMLFLFFFKQKTAYEMRISDWSADVCSSDLDVRDRLERLDDAAIVGGMDNRAGRMADEIEQPDRRALAVEFGKIAEHPPAQRDAGKGPACGGVDSRSEEHTSELQSLMRISYAVFCLKKKKKIKRGDTPTSI